MGTWTPYLTTNEQGVRSKTLRISFLKAVCYHTRVLFSKTCFFQVYLPDKTSELSQSLREKEEPKALRQYNLPTELLNLCKIPQWLTHQELPNFAGGWACNCPKPYTLGFRSIICVIYGPSYRCWSTAVAVEEYLRFINGNLRRSHFCMPPRLVAGGVLRGSILGPLLFFNITNEELSSVPRGALFLWACEKKVCSFKPNKFSAAVRGIDARLAAMDGLSTSWMMCL